MHIILEYVYHYTLLLASLIGESAMQLLQALGFANTPLCDTINKLCQHVDQLQKYVFQSFKWHDYSSDE